MTKRSNFPLANVCITLAALSIVLFLFIVPRRYLVQVAGDLQAGAIEAQQAVLQGDLARADMALNRMCTRLGDTEEPLKLFLNHEDLHELKASLEAARNLARIDESGNLLTELQNVLRILDHLVASETLNLYNLF